MSKLVSAWISIVTVLSSASTGWLADMPVVLMALDATIAAQGGQGAFTVPIAELVLQSQEG